MNANLVTGAIGLVLLLAFVLPPLLKLQNVALTVVALITIAMAVYEFYECVRDKDN
ncbi:MAG TPA: hypothetical protein VIS73_10720 [Rhodocyclaceae bacterium]